MTLLVEMGWGGLVQAPTTITWTDITQRVDDQVRGVTITRGASDELSETQWGTATLVLDNEDGAVTPGNSLSPYAPYVRKNAPIRISKAIIPTRSGSSPYPLAMLGDDFDDNRISTVLWPNSYGGASEVGGRARIPVNPGVVAGYQSAREWTLVGSKLTAMLATLPAVGGSSSGTASMWVNSTTSGTRLGWRFDVVARTVSCQNQTAFSDGSAVTTAYSAIDHKWLRVREDGGTVYWESSGDGFGWTVRRTLAAPSWVTSQTHAVEMAATRTGGTGDYVEWDLVGADIRPRFFGVVNEWPVEWEGLLSKVTISCSDLFKRLSKAPNLRSMLGEEILHQDVAGVTDIVSAYYPLSEPSGSASAGDLSGGGCGSLAVTQQGTGGTCEFGGESIGVTGESTVTFAPSSSSNGKYLTGDLGVQFETTSSTYQMCLEFWVKTTTTNRAILGLYSAGDDYQIAVIVNSSGNLAVDYTDTGGTLSTHTTGDVVNDGEWHHILIDLADSNNPFYIDGVSEGVMLTVPPPLYGLRYLHVGGYRGARMFDGQIAHVAVTHVGGNDAGATLAPLHYEAATTGFAGEDADVRIERLARYAGLSSVTVWGTTHDPIASQGEGGNGVLSRMRDVESTESGRLFAERDWYGLAYQSRDVRYNPSPGSEVFTIAYADLETGNVQLSDDDQKMINIVEASRPGGATQRVTAPASILAYGEYPKPLDVLKTTDNSVLDAAAWLVSRYADPPPEIREVAIEAHTMGSTYLDILDAEISSYFSVTSLPDEAPASSLRCTVEGYTETLKHNSHLIQFHTSLAATDSVWVLDDSVYSVLGSTTRLAY